MGENIEHLPPEADDVIFMGAVAAIFRGDLEGGLPHIAALAAEGYERAAATQAQILAYRGEWDAAGDYAGQFLLNPATGSSHDMYLDMWRVLALSAIHTGDWQWPLQVVAQARGIYANAFSNKKHPRIVYLRTFGKFITTCGAGDLPEPIFPRPTQGKDEARSLIANLERYYVENTAEARGWPEHVLKQSVARRDIYNSSMDYYLPEEIMAFYEYCQVPPDGYNQRLFLAKAFIFAGAKHEAKYMIELASDAYVPHDLADILPVGALWDPDCRKATPQIKVDKLLLRKKEITVDSFHRIAVDKIAAINSRKQHTRLLAEQASFADINRWEDQLSGDPTNLELRTLLLHCYRDRTKLYTECADNHARHTFWIIKNAPHTVLAGDQLCMLILPGQQAHYATGKKLWLAALRKKDTTAQMVMNAANYLRYDASGQ